MVYELNTIHVSEAFTVASPLWRFHDDFKLHQKHLLSFKISPDLSKDRTLGFQFSLVQP